MEFESAGAKLYLPCHPSNSGLIIRIIVLIPRQSFASPRGRFDRENRLQRAPASRRWPPDGSTPTGLLSLSLFSLLSLSTASSDSHLHLRSFPALSLCSRPFSPTPVPSPGPDLTRPIPRGNYVAPGKPGICIERISFRAYRARSLCAPDPRQVSRLFPFPRHR